MLLAATSGFTAPAHAWECNLTDFEANMLWCKNNNLQWTYIKDAGQNCDSEKVMGGFDVCQTGVPKADQIIGIANACWQKFPSSPANIALKIAGIQSTKCD